MKRERKPKSSKEQAEKPWQFQPGQSGNPAGRPPGAISQVLKMAREAAVNVGLPKLIEAAEGGDLYAARTLVQLGLPKPKPMAEPEPFPLTGDTLTDKANSILQLVSEGHLSSDTGGEVVSMLATAAKIEEVEQLREQVERFKALLDGRKEAAKAEKGR